jgi:hypothetical protein
MEAAWGAARVALQQGRHPFDVVLSKGNCGGVTLHELCYTREPMITQS